MGLAEILNQELTDLRHALQRGDDEEIQARCDNLNYSLWHVRYRENLPSLRLDIYVDSTLREIPEDDGVYRPNAYFWQRVMPNHGRGVPEYFSIYQPFLQEERFSFYGVDFAYTGPHKVECRLYIEAVSHTPQLDDDIILEEPEKLCLIVFPHEIFEFAQNGKRDVTEFTL